MVISSDNGGAVVTEAVMVALFVGLAVVCVDCETWEGALLLLSIVEIVFFSYYGSCGCCFPLGVFVPASVFSLVLPLMM